MTFPGQRDAGRGALVTRVGLFFLFSFMCCTTLQLASGAHWNDFSGTPDEAGHFVTGVWLRDLLVSLQWTSPREHAETFYLHYPKLAIGHWGPVFYLIQGTWFLMCGPSRFAAMLLMAAISATLSTLVFVEIHRTSSAKLALVTIAALCVVLLPVLRDYSHAVMTEPLSTLFVFVATVYWGKFLACVNPRSSLLFGVFASLAILTKGNGLCLVLLPILSTCLCRQTYLWRRMEFWLPAIVVAVVCAPWYLMTLDMQRNGMASESFSLAFLQSSLPFYLTGSLQTVGYGLSCLAVIGAGALLRHGSSAVRCTGATHVSLLLSVLLFHILVPCGFASRHLSLIVPSVLILGSEGVSQIVKRARLTRRADFEAFMLLIVCLLFVPNIFDLPRPNRGSEQVIREILRTCPNDELGILISSDSKGDGAFVSEVLLQDTQRPNRFALRASKVLAQSSWRGRDHKLAFAGPEDVSDWLHRVRVGIVVIDRTQLVRSRSEHVQLQQAIERHPERWELLGRYDIVRNGVHHKAGIAVFKQKCLDDYRIGSFSIDMTRMLGKSLGK